nr:hypothetical protein [Tanacetum cinerariifolium]
AIVRASSLGLGCTSVVALGTSLYRLPVRFTPVFAGTCSEAQAKPAIRENAPRWYR